LTAELRRLAASHLQRLWARCGDPLTGSLNWRNLSGRRRERFTVQNDFGRNAIKRGFVLLLRPEERLYALWTYARYTGDWPLIERYWDHIRAVAHSIDPAAIESGSGPALSVNRRAASLVGYARMAGELSRRGRHRAGYEREHRWALQAAAEALRARLEWEAAHRPSGQPWSTNWLKEKGRFDAFMDTGWGSGGQIARYEGLVPPIARLLRDYMPGDVQLHEAFLDVVVPAQGLSYTFIPNRGEIFSNLPHQAMQVFLAKALLMQADRAELRHLLSFAWCRGDLYFIRKLAWAIARSAAGPHATGRSSAQRQMPQQATAAGPPRHATAR